MSLDFETMMGNRAETNKKAAEFVTGGFKKDERFWELEAGKGGSGMAIIRFLPRKDFSKNPFVTKHRHGFKKGSKFLYEVCPKTLGWEEDCPICDYLNPLYDDFVLDGNGKKIFKEEAQIKLLKRKYENIINIRVIDDKVNPENNGKVFLFKMNGIILPMYKDAINPPSEFITPKVVYDFIEGVNFEYMVIAPAKKDDYNDYKKSRFLDTSTPVADTKEGMKEIWEALYDLDEFTDDKQIHSFEDINSKFRKIYLGENGVSKSPDGSFTPAQKVEGMSELPDPFDVKEEPNEMTFDEAPTDADPEKKEDSDDDSGFNFDAPA